MESGNAQTWKSPVALPLKTRRIVKAKVDAMNAIHCLDLSNARISSHLNKAASWFANLAPHDFSIFLIENDSQFSSCGTKMRHFHSRVYTEKQRSSGAVSEKSLLDWEWNSAKKRPSLRRRRETLRRSLIGSKLWTDFLGWIDAANDNNTGLFQRICPDLFCGKLFQNETDAHYKKTPHFKRLIDSLSKFTKNGDFRPKNATIVSFDFWAVKN